ncbi:ArsR family transcriptional regulator [Micromonospora zingiberis]|uniref:ArsR family transcriptional regulator n=1 Tax=Micromonospora zingiberis TaxID=2053011 RepID=A0A4R0GIT7_9ACTN|nr:winged helix-turn-helix domain-containing protein [Micromonospora zingiberis]TCB95298.1 ArsR family transcriptional regulator [Micromonospora zingiberis]
MAEMSNGAEPRVVHVDARQIRALAHPLRVQLLGALRTSGPATATELAAELDTNTGATSYHLRQLAEVGLVVEEPAEGAGRRRYWRAAHDVSSWQTTDFEGDPEARAAADWLQGRQFQFVAEFAQRWIAVQHDRPREWRAAVDFSDTLLTLSPAQLRALNDELWAVIKRYRDADVPEAPDAPAAEQVILFVAGFPLVPGAR